MTFELITFAEKLIRKCQSQFLSAASNIGEILSTQINDATPYIIFPDCHNIKQKIISRYVTVRLHFFAKKESKFREKLIKKSLDYEMGSKSMAMHKMVESVK